MKPFIRISMSNGMTFELATKAIADHRAKTMLEAHPDEFKDLAAANEDTIGLFTDDSWNIQDWAANNMNWSELEPHARMIRFTPPDMAQWHDGEVTYHDQPAMLGEVDGDAIMRQPLEVTLNVMAASAQLCNVSIINSPDGQPFAAAALILGGNEVLSPFVLALQHVAGQFAPASLVPASQQH